MDSRANERSRLMSQYNNLSKENLDDDSDYGNGTPSSPMSNNYLNRGRVQPNEQQRLNAQKYLRAGGLNTGN